MAGQDNWVSQRSVPVFDPDRGVVDFAVFERTEGVTDVTRSRLQRLRNDGAGTFSIQSTRALDRWLLSSVASLDADGDERQDVLAVYGGFTDTTMIFPQRDSEGFADPLLMNTAKLATSVTVADLTGDGRPEIVIGHDPTGISVRENLGGGSFADPVLSPTDARVLTVLVQDLDGDGIPEILAEESFATRVYARRSDGGPLEYEAVAIADVPGMLAGAVDLDGDGVMEIVISGDYVRFARYEPGRMEIQYTGIPGGSGRIADMDGDGQLDVVLGQPNKTITVLK